MQASVTQSQSPAGLSLAIRNASASVFNTDTTLGCPRPIGANPRPRLRSQAAVSGCKSPQRFRASNAAHSGNLTACFGSTVCARLLNNPLTSPRTLCQPIVARSLASLPQIAHSTQQRFRVLARRDGPQCDQPRKYLPGTRPIFPFVGAKRFEKCGIGCFSSPPSFKWNPGSRAAYAVLASSAPYSRSLRDTASS